MKKSYKIAVNVSFNIFYIFNEKEVDKIKTKNQRHLAVQPNFEMPGGPNPKNTKIYLSNFEYNLLNKHVEYSDQHTGAVHPSLCNQRF